MKPLAVIVYTTRYKKGGELFQHVAETLARHKAPAFEVIAKPTETKAELKALFQQLAGAGRQIDEFHFVGHSGMYGPMFGTIHYPEQFSPHEIRIINIPFADKATASFHCCRSARWFAPFFARAQHVSTYGFHWYTAFSSKPDRYRAVWSHERNQDLYCFGCPGKKSHGLLASIKKYTGTMAAEELKRFDDEAPADASYDPIAELYNETFSDITVRRDELKFIIDSLGDASGKVVVDIGCGNGALLSHLATSIGQGIGLDASANLVALANKRTSASGNLSFKEIDGPALPLPDQSADAIISMLSFRYLDWDPILKEIERVLRPNGKLIVVDMVTAPVRWREVPQFLFDKAREYRRRFSDRAWHARLNKLVNHPGWTKMLQYNPIRSEHEMKWYLESRFPGRKAQRINIGYHSRILAFDSVDMKNVANINLTYP